jgi:hypothetical protein
MKILRKNPLKVDKKVAPRQFSPPQPYLITLIPNAPLGAMKRGGGKMGGGRP